MTGLHYLKNVTTLQSFPDKCIGCGMCREVCPHEVLGLDNAVRVIIEDRDACMECGACSRNCPTGALSVRTGVGCAAAVINALLGREGECCCTIDSSNQKREKTSGCC